MGMNSSTLGALDLAGNLLMGALPDAWAALGALSMLSLGSNMLTGTIPTGGVGLLLDAQ